MTISIKDAPILMKKIGKKPSPSLIKQSKKVKNLFHNRDPRDEIKFAVYRHSHFYFGLIRLYQGDIDKANLHFKRSIGFEDENEMGEQFYSIANFMDPYWIALAILTSLQIGHVKKQKIYVVWDYARKIMLKALIGYIIAISGLLRNAYRKNT
jgi:hypothetical protein